MNDIIKRMSQDIHTQDNAITADPIFMVQEKKRIYGIHLDYDHTGTKFVDSNDAEAPADETTRREVYDEALKAGDLEPLVIIPYDQWRKTFGNDVGATDEKRKAHYARYVRGAEKEHFLDFCADNYTEVGYRDIWVNVQPFFTRVGAEAYLEINGHNLKEPRIYVESAYRNAEWQAIRKFLQEPGVEDGGTSVRDNMLPVSTAAPKE